MWVILLSFFICTVSVLFCEGVCIVLFVCVDFSVCCLCVRVCV